MESRALLSIPGVTLQFGNLAITATKASGNVAQVSIDSSNKNVRVAFNGQTEEFSPGQVLNITYKGGISGGDSFVNNTQLTDLAYCYGGSNSFSGGTGYNYVFFFGNNNTYHGQGGYTDVWEGWGKNDTINGLGTIVVYLN
jgi:hypothetical protein